jgi:hypothetical protein
MEHFGVPGQQGVQHFSKLLPRAWYFAVHLSHADAGYN